MSQDIVDIGLSVDSSEVKRGRNELDKFSKQGKETSRATDKLSGSFDKLKAAAAGFFSVMAVRELAQTIGKFQALETSLGVVFGNIKKGSAVFLDIQKLAGDTPFSIEQLTESVIKLRAAGIDPTKAQMTLFSDVASVTTDKVGALQAITDLFARTTAGGLGLEDLNRLADRGIPVFDILSKKLGLARLDVAKFGETTEGATKILGALTEELNARFGGASKKAASELETSISNMGIAWRGFQKDIGDAGALTIMTIAVQEATSVLDFMGQNLTELGIIAVGLSTLALPALVGGIKAVTLAMAANPIGLVVVGLTALAVAAYEFRSVIANTIITAFELTIPNAINKAQIAFLKMRQSVGELLNDILSKMNSFGNKMVNSTPKWFKKLFGIGGETFSLSINLKDVNSQIDALEATINERANNFVLPDAYRDALKVSATNDGLSDSGSLTGDKVGTATGGVKTISAKELEENERIRQALAERFQVYADAQFTEGELQLMRFEEDRLANQAARDQGLIDEELHAKRLRELNDAELKYKIDSTKQADQIILNSRMNVLNQLVNLARTFAGENKAIAIAAIAVEKGIAIAQTYISGVAAAQAAGAHAAVAGGLPAYAAAYGSVMGMTKLSMGLIAATGIAQAASVDRGGASLGSAGNPVNTTQPTQTVQPIQQTQQQAGPTFIFNNNGTQISVEDTDQWFADSIKRAADFDMFTVEVSGQRGRVF